MIQDFPVPEVPYLHAQNYDYLGDSSKIGHLSFVVPGIRQQSFVIPATATINPILLSGYGGTECPDLQFDASQTSPLISEDGFYQLSSPIASTSTLNHRMGSTCGDFSASMPSPISPLVESTNASHITLADKCLCGCDRGPCIPQRDYERQKTDPLNEYHLQETILFSVGGKCGFPLKDALKKHYTNLDGRDEKVFVGFKSSISIRLEWLPYPKWTKQIRTLTWRKTPEHITRAKLATEVAKRMNIFFHEMQNKEADSPYYEYRVQPGVIDINHLDLVALKRVAKSSYMPHFRRSFAASQSHSQ